MKRESSRVMSDPSPARFEWARGWLLAAMTALLVARPLWPSESAARTGDGLPIVMLWLLLALAWLGAGLFAGGLKVKLARLDGLVALLVATNCVAALAAAWRDTPRPAVNMLWEWVALGLAYFLARQLITNLAEARAVLVVMMGLAAGVASHGLYQYFVTMPETRAEYAQHPDETLRREGLWYPSGSVERALFEQRLASREPLASFALTNSLAGLLTPWVVVAAAVALTLRPKQDPVTRTLVAGALTLAVTGLCLVLTKSRSAYAGTALGVLASAAIVLRHRGRLDRRIVGGAMVLVLVAIVAGIVSGGLDVEVLTEAPKSLGYRWQYWQATLRMIADYPWLGVGPGEFGDRYTRYKLATASEEISDPHNFVLEMWSTAGPIAALAMVGLVCAVLASVVRRWAAATDALSEQSVDGSKAPLVLLGAIGGVLLAVALPIVTGALLEAPYSVYNLPVDGVIGALVIWLWWPWVVRGGVSNWIPAVGALALWVNLLAAGGIGYPAVAGSLWLLVALAVSCRGGGQTREMGPQPVFAGWLIVLVATAACFASAYRPVLIASGWSVRALANPARAEDALLRAVEADPQASLPWARLADLRFQRWQARPSLDAWQTYMEAQEAALHMRPHQSALWLVTGDRQMAGHRQRPELLRLADAVASYRQAVALYPNHAAGRAKLALALAAIGDRAEAQREANEAWSLDQATPHVDQKLRPDLRAALEASGLLKSAATRATSPSSIGDVAKPRP